jgi:hypothetical protein
MPILDQVRAHVETGLTDEALGRLIADAVEDVEGRFGNDAEKTVVLRGDGLALLRLIRPASAITSITEQRYLSQAGVLLDPTDYELRPGGRLLERLPSTGTWGYWGRKVTVVYDPIPEISLRDRLVIDLVQLAVQHNGLQSEKIGDYSSSSQEYTKAREQILQGGSNHRGLRFA